MDSIQIDLESECEVTAREFDQPVRTVWSNCVIELYDWTVWESYTIELFKRALGSSSTRALKAL